MDVVREKFMQCAHYSGICSPEQAARIMGCIDNIEEYETVRKFYDACRLRNGKLRENSH